MKARQQEPPHLAQTAKDGGVVNEIVPAERHLDRLRNWRGGK
jgi:hypothetical protein